LCNKYGIKVKVNTIITKYNCNFNVINNMLSVLLKHENVYEITIGHAGYSINNKHSYLTEIAPAFSCLNMLINKLKDVYNNEKRVVISDVDGFSENFRFSQEKFFDKAVCSGNLFQFYLLPDGKTTLCEELYWHPRFILGDLTKQSIMEMWQGEKAMALYNIQQKEFKTDSSCSSCKLFDYCHKNAAVCWKEVMENYGVDKWYYPDTRCLKRKFTKNNKLKRPHNY
ncbi:MAG: SPASM domain-containing protein, partial [Bacteroidales bacterium]|nr:SPASM domain-containing protein [Bacteroidales bacterium]